EIGGLTMVGATGSVLKRSLASMQGLIDTSLAEVRAPRATATSAIFFVASLIHEAKASADLGSGARNQTLTVADVNSHLRVEANRERILAALANLLSNAFKFSHPHSEIKLSAELVGDRVCLNVEDSCGGLLPDHEEKIFKPFLQFGDDRSGLGLGLSIARQNVEADGGTLTVRNKPGSGCVFTIALPNCTERRPG
ncbi:MAG: HAMP domain-containing sensor histidine kinase, partial [Ideonella sp.]